MQIILGVLLGMLASCQSSSVQPQDEDLRPLTLAEVYRNSDQRSQAEMDRCSFDSSGSWICSPRDGYMGGSAVAPVDVAPFMAQVYLHPEFTTEQDLIEQGAQDRPRWSIRHICGGVLIAPNWVATAAHCFPDPRVDTKYGVRLGLNNIQNDRGQLYKVEQVVRRDPDGRTRDNDLALVRIDRGSDSASIASQSAISTMARQAPAVLYAASEFISNGRLVLTSDDQFHIFDKTNNRLSLSGDYGRALYRLKNGSEILGWDGSGIIITNLKNSDQNRSFSFPNTEYAAVFEDEEKVIAASFIERDIRIYDVETGEISRKITTDYARPIVEILGKDGNFLVWPNGSSHELFNANSDESWKLQVPENAYYLGSAPENSGLNFFDYQTNFAFVIDPNNGRLKASKYVGKLAEVYTENTLITRSGETLFFYDRSTLELLATSSNSMEVHPGTGSDLLVIKSATAIDIVRNRNFSEAATIEVGAGVEINGVYDLPNSDMVAFETLLISAQPSVSHYEHPKLYIAETGPQSQGIFDLTEALIAEVVSGPQKQLDIYDLGNKKVLVVNLIAGRSYIWDINACASGEEPCPPAQVMDHNVSLNTVLLEPDKNRFLALADNGTVQLWDLRSGEERVRIHQGGLAYGAEYNEARDELVTYGANGFLRIWDVKTGNEIHRVDFADHYRFGQPEPVFITSPVREAGELIGPGAADAQAVYISIDENGDQLQDGSQVRAYGWGRYEDGGASRRSPALREASFRVLNSETCKSSQYWDGHADIHDKTFCAYDQTRKTCAGDSGGPVVQGDALGSLKLVGIASWGSPKCEADGRPGVFTRIASHADWIKGMISGGNPTE